MTLSASARQPSAAEEIDSGCEQDIRWKGVRTRRASRLSISDRLQHHAALQPSTHSRTPVSSSASLVAAAPAATFARASIRKPLLAFCPHSLPPLDSRHHTAGSAPANQNAQADGRFGQACRGHHTLCFIARQPIVGGSGAFIVCGLHPRILGA